MASTLTTFASLLKRRYDKVRVENLTLGESPLLAMLPKDTGGSGDGHNVPMIYGRPQGIGGSYADAATAKSNLASKHFVMTYGDYDGAVDIGRKVLKAARNNLGAFLDNKTSEIDNLYSQMSDELCTYLYGNGGGALGRRSSASTNVITLTNPSDVYNFEVGMTVVASDEEGDVSSDALRTGSTTVASVQREDGTVTLTSAAGISAFADNDYLFRYGCFNGAEGKFIIHGLSSFIAATSSPADLYSMTRTADPVRLAGCRVPSTAIAGKGIEERLDVLGAYMHGRYKSRKFDCVFMHPEQFQKLGVAMKSQGIRELSDNTTRFGFTAIKGIVGGRSVDIYPDAHCPPSTAFVISKGFFKLWSMGELFAPVNEDGLYILRKSGSNDFEHRVESFPALVTNGPLYHGRVTLA